MQLAYELSACYMARSTVEAGYLAVMLHACCVCPCSVNFLIRIMERDRARGDKNEWRQSNRLRFADFYLLYGLLDPLEGFCRCVTKKANFCRCSRFLLSVKILINCNLTLQKIFQLCTNPVHFLSFSNLILEYCNPFSSCQN